MSIRFGIAAACTLASATAIAHPDHPDPDPAEPKGPSESTELTDADLITAATALAEQQTGETIEVKDDAPAESASSVHIDREKLRYRSSTQPSDILRQVPGLVVSQHAGGGKSDQYFIRGFDADHGTDIAIFADGIPVNHPSHGHGQGYADTHFLIPETIGSVDVHKGPYAARYGDFYTAGALELKTIDEVAEPTLWVAAGGPLAGPRAFDNYNRRLVGMASPKLTGDDKSLIALQIADSDGPFIDPQDFKQGNALVKWQGKAGPGVLKLETAWYAAHWNASGQLPASEVEAGRLNRFDSLDPTEGGTTSRSSAQVEYTIHGETGDAWHAMAYGVDSRLKLFSNFTLFARDPEHGDQIEQLDSRVYYGLDAGYERWIDAGPVHALVTAGAQVRNDDVETGLWHDEARVRLPDCFNDGANPCNHDSDHIRDLAAYAEANVIPTSWLHIFPGIRVDQLTWDVDDLDPKTQLDPATTTGGTASSAIISPKLSIELHPSDTINFFINTGAGFHSNDARAAVATHGDGALARALGAELGVRMKPDRRARVSADIWYLQLSSEQVWSGDAGGTEASGATRRFGMDLEGSVDPSDWLSLDANVTFAHATFVANQGNGGALALAPRWMGSGGASVHDKTQFVSLRARGIGDRPGNDAGTLVAQGYLIFDLIAGRKFGRLDLDLTINNLFNSDWREAQFADTSAIARSATPVEQMHFTPGVPLTATLTAAYTF